MSKETIEKAKKFWDPKENRTSFEEDLAFHLAAPHALVFSFEGSMIFARPVSVLKSEEWETYKSWPIADCDAWYIWLAIGKADTLLHLMDKLAPELPLIIRKKNDKLRVVETKKLKELLKYE